MTPVTPAWMPQWPFQPFQETILLALHASSEWLQAFMKLVSDLNGTLVYLCVIAVFLWTVNKQIGRMLGFVLVLSEGVGGTLKYLVHSNRPYFDQGLLAELQHPALTAAEYPLGYSFPSGHSFNVSAFWGSLAVALNRKRWVVVAAVALIFVVGLSRVSLAAHWPLDVLGGWTFGTLVVLGVWFTRRSWANLRLGGMSVVLVSGLFVLLAAATYWAVPFGNEYSLMLVDTQSSQPPFYAVCPTDPPAEMRSDCAPEKVVYISPDGKQPSSIPYGWRMIALGFGLLLGALLEERRVQFDPRVGGLPVQLLKLVIGIPITLCAWYVFSPGVFSAMAKSPALPLAQNAVAGFVVAFVLPWVFARLWRESRRSA